MEVLIGVDPHKATNVVAAVDEQGGLVGQRTSRQTARECGLWSAGRTAFRSAVGPWRALAASVAHWHRSSWPEASKLVDVPPKLSAKVRVLSTGNARKNDRLDATFTALAALRNDRLASVQPEDGPEGHAEILRLLTERREDLVAERTRSLNRLHVLLRTSSPILLGSSSPPMPPPSCCAAPSHGTRLDGSADGWPPSWCETFAPSTGGSPIWTSASGRRWRSLAPPSPRSSARTHTGGQDRRHRGQCGAVPEQSALRLLRGRGADRGLQREVVRHRLSLAGNRSLNKVMHMIAVCQARSDPRGGVPSEEAGGGKSRKEAMRCLKRRVSDAVFALVAIRARFSRTDLTQRGM